MAPESKPVRLFSGTETVISHIRFELKVGEDLIMKSDPQEIKNEKVETIREKVKKGLTVRIPIIDPIFQTTKPVETSYGVNIQYLVNFDGDSGILFLKSTELPTIDGFNVRSSIYVEPTISRCINCGWNGKFVRIHTFWSNLGEKNEEKESTYCPSCAHHENGLKPEMDVIKSSIPDAIVDGSTITLSFSYSDPIPGAEVRDIIGMYFCTALATMLRALDDELKTDPHLHDVDKCLDEMILVRKDRLNRLDHLGP
ncbi:MAG: hypothetical protein JET69_04035 [Methanomassiliicoccales archaeon]|nr:hypothetical protein [Methanomassiliicoccales archaeon]